MGNSCAQYGLKRQNPIERASPSEETGATTLEKSPPPTAEMPVAKMLFNSVISMKGARFMTMDISNSYLMTPTSRTMSIDKYKLKEKATLDGSIYIKAKQSMYSLLQSGLLANELLKKRLNKHGYRQSKLVPGL
jgi:hypothetical protein